MTVSILGATEAILAVCGTVLGVTRCNWDRAGWNWDDTEGD